MNRDMVGVIRDEVALHPVNLGGRQRAPIGLEATLDHHTRAASDHGASALIGEGWQTRTREHDIEGGREIGRRVDKRSVEIKDYGQGAHVCRWLGYFLAGGKSVVRGTSVPIPKFA